MYSDISPPFSWILCFVTFNLMPRSSNIILPDPFLSLVMRYTVICWLEVSPRAKKKKERKKKKESEEMRMKGEL